MKLNLLLPNAYTFDDGVNEWTVVNGTVRRELNTAPYGFYYSSFSTVERPLKNSAKIIADGLGITTLTSDSFTVVDGNVYIASVRVQTDLIGTETFAELEILWEDAVGNPIAGSTVSYAEISQDSLSENAWFILVSRSEAPVGAAQGRLALTFSKTTYDVGFPDSGDVFRLVEPIVVDLADVETFANTVYQSVPEFMRLSDTSNLYLYRLMASFSSAASDIAEIATSFRYDRLIDGNEHLSQLTDPLTADVTYLPWIAYLLGASLISAEGESTANWNLITGTWDALEAAYITWAELEAAGGVSLNGTLLNRQLLSSGASGINAGRTDSLERFLPNLTTDGSTPIVKNQYRGSAFLAEIIATGTGVVGGGAIIDRFAQFILPIGTSSEVTVSNMPLAESAYYRFFDSSIGDGELGARPLAAVNHPEQGFANEEGGDVTSSLKVSPLHDDPILGGIIAPAPFANGFALLGGYRVEAKTDGATSLDLGADATSSEDFDLFIQLSSVTIPTDASGTGTESGTDARVIAKGSNWSLHLTKSQALKFVWDVGGTPFTVTSSATYQFEEESRYRPVWLRVHKSGTTLKFYVQRSLYDDWSESQIGTDLTLSASNVTNPATTAAYVSLLTADDPGTNAYETGLSCAVHRCLLFTAAEGTPAWEPEYRGGYIYDNSLAALDIDFITDPEMVNYQDSFSESASGIAVTVSNNGGANDTDFSLSAEDIESGTSTAGTNNTTLIDTGKTFVTTAAVQAGMKLVVAGKGYRYVVSVDSETQLTLRGGTAQGITSGDSYLIQDDYVTFSNDTLYINRIPDLRAYSEASWAIVMRRAGATSDNLLKIVDSSGNGLTMSTVTTNNQVSITDGTNTLTVSSDTSAEYGNWFTVVARYRPSTGLSLLVNGTEVATDNSSPLTTLFADTATFGDAINLSSTDVRALLGFERYLTDAECVALSTEYGT